MTDPERYCLTLSLDGRPAMTGWWGSEATARRKWSAMMGEYGRPGARVVLVDTDTGEQLANWPSETSPVVGGGS